MADVRCSERCTVHASARIQAAGRSKHLGNVVKGNAKRKRVRLRVRLRGGAVERGRSGGPAPPARTGTGDPARRRRRGEPLTEDAGDGHAPSLSRPRARASRDREARGLSFAAPHEEGPLPHSPGRDRRARRARGAAGLRPRVERARPLARRRGRARRARACALVRPPQALRGGPEHPGRLPRPGGGAELLGLLVRALPGPSRRCWSAGTGGSRRTGAARCSAWTART